MATDKTLQRIFQNPPPANIRWTAIESTLINLGAELSEGSGSRIRVELHGMRAVLHRPHPRPEASRPQVRAVRLLLERAGVQP